MFVQYQLTPKSLVTVLTSLLLGFPWLPCAELPWALSSLMSFLSWSPSCVASSEEVRKEEAFGNLTKKKGKAMGKGVKIEDWGPRGILLDRFQLLPQLFLISVICA